MLNHAAACRRQTGMSVDLVGYHGIDLPDAFYADPDIAIHSITSVGTKRWPQLPAVVFLPAAALRVLWISVRLAWIVLFRLHRPDVVLIQNPPAVPLGLIALAAARMRRAALIVDWHNMSAAMLALRLGADHFVVRMVSAVEGWIGRHADFNLCVSRAMADHMEQRHGISGARVLHDRPIAVAPRLDDERRFQVIGEAMTALGHAAPSPDEIARSVVAVSPTSWSADEDMGMLLDGLHRYVEVWRRTMPVARPTVPILLFATGLGPLRSAFEERARSLAGAEIQIITGWLPATLYRDLLRAADIGISMHRSASGLDIPIKLLDMIGAELPPIAFDFGVCLDEVLPDPIRAMGFDDADTLASRLTSIAGAPDKARVLDRLRAQLAVGRKATWMEEWSRVVGPMLGRSEPE